MKYGFVIPGGDVKDHLEIGKEIEAAGWDAVFVADGVYGTDPWISLAALAAHTERVRLGPLLTPVSRRRPWKLASETATLDRLSDGRVILCVGLGATDTGFDQVGEATDRKIRAELLDEGLELLTLFWAGKPFAFSGKHYRVNWDNSWSYTPVQSPRIPIWVVGAWPRKASVRRALRYDGLLAARMTEDSRFVDVTPEDVREIKAFAGDYRATDAPIDIIVEGITPGNDAVKAEEILVPLAQAGVTWWIESMWDVPGGMSAVRERIEQGPPRIEAINKVLAAP
jgi:alkanesulfonate monooxygenase SsuD/methylene tetrahydromethanopterin reductase-like flavin-dependent oxidoreductase (luciferase family)